MSESLDQLIGARNESNFGITKSQDLLVSRVDDLELSSRDEATYMRGTSPPLVPGYFPASQLDTIFRPTLLQIDLARAGNQLRSPHRRPGLIFSHSCYPCRLVLSRIPDIMAENPADLLFGVQKRFLESLREQERSARPPMLPPNRFGGAEAELDEFLWTCRRCFSKAPALYATADDRVSFASTYLTGRAFTWYQTATRSLEQPWETYELFEADLRRAFGDPLASYHAKVQLATLRQGTAHFRNHWAQFHALTAKAGFSETNEALYCVLLASLAPSLLTQVRALPTPPQTAMELRDACFLLSGMPPLPTAPAPTPTSTPMQVDAVVTRSAKTNRAPKAYVGVGHQVFSADAATAVFRQRITISGNTTMALVDSGASRCCISEAARKKWKLPTRRLQLPIRVRFGNGVEHCLASETTMLHVYVPAAGTSSRVSFLVVPGLSHRVILGLSWLKDTRPVIDWSRPAIVAGRSGETAPQTKSPLATEARRKPTASEKRTKRQPRPAIQPAVPPATFGVGGAEPPPTLTEEPGADVLQSPTPCRMAIGTKFPAPGGASDEASLPAADDKSRSQQSRQAICEAGRRRREARREAMRAAAPPRTNSTRGVAAERKAKSPNTTPPDIPAPQPVADAAPALPPTEPIPKVASQPPTDAHTEAPETTVIATKRPNSEPIEARSPVPKTFKASDEPVRLGHHLNDRLTSHLLVLQSLPPAEATGIALDAPEEDSSDDEDLTGLPEDLMDFHKVFGTRGAERLPPHSEFDCTIETVKPLSSLPHRPLYDISGKQSRLLDEYIDANVAKGFMRPSKSPAGSPMFFVPKADGSLRPVADYRALNEITAPDRFPLPLIPRMLRLAGQGKVFSKIDLRNAYNLVRIRDGDEPKTAVRTHKGVFEYCVMPFGLCNAPAVFQRMMTARFSHLLDVSVVIYLDDILVFSKDKESNLATVREVLRVLQQHGLYAKLSKCCFFVPRVEFLGFIISPDGIEMNPAKLDAVKSWPRPTNRTELQQFLGFANFYRKFVPSFSSVAKPLTDLTSTKVRFAWDAACDRAFHRMKALLLKDTVLKHYRPELPIVVETDASDFGLGAVLTQTHRIRGREVRCPVEFFSRKLLPAEQNYDAHDKELLAIVAALKFWRPYLAGTTTPFTVLSDHKNLSWFTTKRELRPRHVRWAETLADYRFVLSYRPGTENAAADALSRRPDYKGGESAARTGVVLDPSTFISVAETVSPKTVVAQKARQWRLIQERHGNKLSGHVGTEKTFELLARDYMWPGMRKMVADFVKACPACQRNKTFRHPPYGELQPLPVAIRPWGSITMDFVVKLPPSQGFDAILVVVCRRTKMCHLIPCQEAISSTGTASLVLREVVRLHGIPDQIVSDRGPQFAASIWKEIWTRLGAKTSLSSAYHPQSDGQSERTNQTVEHMLKHYVSTSQDNWVEVLPLVEFALNNSISSTTGVTPFFAAYGRHPRFTLDGNPWALAGLIAANPNANALKDLDAYITQRQTATNERMRSQSSRRRTPLSLNVGQKVWLSTAHLPLVGPCRKLAPARIGPFKVLELRGPNAVRLDLPQALRRIHAVVNVSRVEPYVPPVTPGQKELNPDPIVVDTEAEYEVERILDMRTVGRETRFLVRWVGYDAAHDSWEPQANLSNAPERLAEFLQTQKLASPTPGGGG